MSHIRRAALCALLLALLALAQAQRLVVYPLTSQDALLGVAVAERIAAAFEAGGELDVYGPEVAPSLAAPLVTEGGFASLVGLLPQEDGRSTDSRAGAAILRGVLGAEAVLTGRVSFAGEELRAELFLAGPESVRRLQVAAPEDEPGQLARRAALLLADALGVARPQADYAIDLSSDDGEYVRAVALAGGGFLEEALQVLSGLGELSPRGEALREDLSAVRVGGQTPRPARLAAFSVNLAPFDAALSQGYFERFAQASDLPVVQTWLATLRANQGDQDGARAAFAEAARRYPYGAAAQAAYLVSRGLAEPDAAFAGLPEDDAAAALSAALVANFEGDTALEKTALTRLTRLAPGYTYPFERLSFIAFDEDDALGAAQALAVAVRQQPQSDLYWTNLGWAYYLLDLFEQSEAASLRAIDLEPSQYIALYNLGLVRAVHGRLDEAMDAYARALALDPEVDDEAVADLEAARERYPDEGAVHYALATLLDQEGRRADAADAFERYLELAPQAPYERSARARLELLLAPLPSVEISPGARLGLGRNLLRSEGFQPGDRVFASFELYTAGAELPPRMAVEASLRRGDEVILADELSVDIPRNAVGYVIEGVSFELPADLPPGSYTLTLLAVGNEEQQAEAEVPLEVSGSPQLVRQLLSRNIVMLALEAATPLYSALSQTEGALLAALGAELRRTAAAAEDALPLVGSGRFEGLSGGELFSRSTPDDLRDFLEYLLAQGAQDATFTFVDAYAQWALDGAPGNAE